MRIETYKDGQLIEVREIEEAFLPPDFSMFSTSVLLSSPYIKLMEAVKGQEVRSTIELLTVRLELKKLVLESDLSLYKMVWDQIIDLAGIAIFTPGDREDLNTKAEAARMPFRFGEDFKLILLSIPP